MNSSTFNSNGEAKAILLTLLIVSVADLGLRLAEAGLSKDVQHIRSFPALARNLSAGPAPRVVFLGNSLTRHGVDPQGWETALERRAMPKGAMTKLVPDDTTMPDWYYVSLNQLIRPGHPPDLLVVGFALNQLSDERLEARRLGAYFCNLGNARELFGRDLDGFAPKVDFLLGRLCRLYGVRDEIQARVGDRFIPGYQAGVRHLNELRRRQPAGRNRAVPGNGPSYELLDRALALWRAEGIDVVLVAMPVPSRYEIDPVIVKKVRAAGARLMDARHLPGLTPADYPDGYHLGRRGAEIYTNFLAENLAESLGRRAGRTRVTARVH
jgi:hypothetical protein